jgi:hypothetical protein
LQEFLAKQFGIAGGDIRNVVLTSAFIAAGSSQSISMEMMSKAMARQLIKQGKAPSATEFKQYFNLLAIRE